MDYAVSLTDMPICVFLIRTELVATEGNNLNPICFDVCGDRFLQ